MPLRSRVNRRSKTGRSAASVFPDPVGDMISTSRRSRTLGIAASWGGVGDPMPASSSSSLSRGESNANALSFTLIGGPQDTSGAYLNADAGPGKLFFHRAKRQARTRRIVQIYTGGNPT